VTVLDFQAFNLDSSAESDVVDQRMSKRPIGIIDPYEPHIIEDLLLEHTNLNVENSLNDDSDEEVYEMSDNDTSELSGPTSARVESLNEQDSLLDADGLECIDPDLLYKNHTSSLSVGILKQQVIFHASERAAILLDTHNLSRLARCNPVFGARHSMGLGYFGRFERINMMETIQERGLVIAASQRGRVCVFQLHSSLGQYYFSAKGIFPNTDAPFSPLLGMAVDKRQINNGATFAGCPIIVHLIYYDGSFLSFQISLPAGTETDLANIVL